MLVISLAAALLAATFGVIAFLAEDPNRTIASLLVVYWAGGIAVFWFTVWLIVSAMRWQPRRDEYDR
jgi:hypothetical protein